MGKTNYVILGMGLAACVFMSLLMQHALKTKQDNEIPPMVTELMRVYGARFSSPVEFSVKPEDGLRTANCVVYPLMSTSGRRLVRRVGDYVWRNVDDAHGFDVLVVTTDDGFGTRVRYQVPSPRDFRGQLRELEDGEKPELSDQAKAKLRSKPAVKQAKSAPPVKTPEKPADKPATVPPAPPK